MFTVVVEVVSVVVLCCNHGRFHCHSLLLSWLFPSLFTVVVEVASVVVVDAVVVVVVVVVVVAVAVDVAVVVIVVVVVVVILDNLYITLTRCLSCAETVSIYLSTSDF